MATLDRSNKALNYLYAPVALLFLVLYIHYWPALGGDVSVFLSYAENMFSHPFSYGPKGRVAYGATSPVWAVLLSLCYSKNPDVFVILIKALNLGLFSLGAWWIAGAFGYPILIAGVLLLLYPSGTFNILLGYENALIVAFIGGICHAYKKENFKLLFLLTSFLPLVRPELVILQLACVWTFRKQLTLVSFLGQAVPYLVYAIYMFSQTGQWIPSSIFARMLKAGADPAQAGAVKTYFAILMSKPIVLLLGALSVAGFFTKDKLLRAFSYALLLFALASVPSNNNRYLYSFIVLGTLIVMWILKETSLHRRMYFATLLLVLPVVCALTYSDFRMRETYLEGRVSTWNIRLVPEMAEILNREMRPGETVLIYEIQGQYYLREKAVSLDGIVGGEAIPYVRAGKIDQFISQHNYLVLGHGSFSGTAYEFLTKSNPQIALNESVSFRGVKFTKIGQNPKWLNEADNRYHQTWMSIYRIDSDKAAERLTNIR